MTDEEQQPVLLLQLLADVAVPIPLPRALTYSIPEELAAEVTPGTRVLCTIGTRKIVGVVVETRRGEPPEKCKPLVSVLEGGALPEDLVAFLRRISHYYLAPIGEVVRLALPPMDRDTAKAIEKAPKVAKKKKGDDEPTLFSAAAKAAAEEEAAANAAKKKKGVSTRQVQWVLATDIVESSIKESLSRVLAVVRAHGALPMSRLAEQFGGARTTIKKLVDLNLVKLEDRDAIRDPFFADTLERDTPPELTEAQAAAIKSIVEAMDATVNASASANTSASSTFLLHGVTGSGKTEVYLRAIGHVKELKRGAIMLVPEIALTPQLVNRFRARFGDDVAVLHSGLTPRERFDMWNRLRDGGVDVAIGARSALFAPVQDLGLVIVDEEHDPSFKQEEGVRYNARDMAILRAHLANAVCVLGSATPSLESEQLTRTGKATKIRLPDRARAQEMPTVEIVDLRRIGAGPTGDRRISIVLHRAIEATLAAKGQTILFLNRRGFAPSIRCEACGELCSCPHCTVALTFHRRGGMGRPNEMRCHWCEYEAPMPVACKKCNSSRIALEGLGTEKLEETLTQAFPEARVARLDRDVASGKQVEKILKRVRDREVDILVGTQMVTKGHDLPHVTLVGVINADAALSIPDFRAAERAFQLLVQVAGRAGRGDSPGKVLIQTYDPDHHAIRLAVKHDVMGFFDRELRDRRELGYPPFSRMVLARIDSMDEKEAQSSAALIARAARMASKNSEGSGGARPPALEDLKTEIGSLTGQPLDVRGPSPAPIAKVRNRYRFRVMLRSASRDRLRAGALAIYAAIQELPRTVRVTIDVDPVGAL